MQIFTRPRGAAALALAALMLPAGGALALSCMPHSVETAYKEAAASKDLYLAVHGVLTFDESLLPKSDMEHQMDVPPQTLIPARIKGEFMDKKGFVTPIDTPLMLDVQCFGPWCAGATSGVPYLAFLKVNGSSYELTVTPCGGNGFAKPSKELMETVQRCHDGGPCEGPKMP